MTLVQLAVLAVVQGACELLPVSSSAHVIIAERLMGLDPSAPQMTLLLVMLHTGTMLAVIAFFWSRWRTRYFATRDGFFSFATKLAVATALTGVIGFALIRFIERVVLGGGPAEVEQLFGNMPLIAIALAVSGVLIVVSGSRVMHASQREIELPGAMVIGGVQALCLPFRGFSRSGATISTGLVFGMDRQRAEDFSFALAVVLTPAAIAREAYRLLGGHQIIATATYSMLDALWTSCIGLALSFSAGWLALRWMSSWLEQGRWQFFGYYCFVASALTLVVSRYF